MPLKMPQKRTEGKERAKAEAVWGKDPGGMI